MDETSYLSLSEAARRSPGRPHAATVWRWARKGIKARDGSTIRLAHVRAGGKIYIRPEALDVFFTAVAAAVKLAVDTVSQNQIGIGRVGREVP